jgi:outer membrane protein assembly factor BamB
MRQAIKLEPGAAGHAAGAEEEGTAQRAQSLPEVLHAGGGEMAAGEINLRANVDAQAFAFHAMEQARVTGEELLQAKVQIAELKAEIRIKEALLLAKDAEVTRLHATMQRRDGEMSASALAKTSEYGKVCAIMDGKPYFSEDHGSTWKLAKLVQAPCGSAKKPCLMALDDEGNIVVADEGSHNLQIIQRTDGALLRTIGGFGTQPGQFIGPRAVAFCGSGNIVVADTLNNRLQILRYIDGSHVLTIGTQANIGLLNRPCAVAVDASGNVFVNDAGNGCLKVFRLSDGELLRSMCSKGSGDGQIQGTGGIAIDKDVLFVADSDNNRVQALRCSDGKHLRNYGTVDTFKYSQPLDVAIYGSDYIVVASYSQLSNRSSTIRIFRKDGFEIRSSNHSYTQACGVIVDVEGRIIVSDRMDRTTKILE